MHLREGGEFQREFQSRGWIGRTWDTDDAVVDHVDVGLGSESTGIILAAGREEVEPARKEVHVET